MDRIAPDTSNHIFYLYYIGTYNNRPIFHYGETEHLELSELKLKRILPYYQCITYVPISHLHRNMTAFEALIHDKRTPPPIPNMDIDNLFVYSLEDLEELKQSVEDIYRVHSDY